MKETLFPNHFKLNARLTEEEKELNELMQKLWLALKGINYYEYDRESLEGYKPLTFWDRRKLEEDRKWFNDVAEEITKKFREGRKDGKVIVIFERKDKEPIAVLRELIVENGHLKVTVGGKKYYVKPEAIEDYEKTVRFGVFKVIAQVGFFGTAY